MKKPITIAVMLVMVAMTCRVAEAVGQQTNNRSNGIIEIVSLNLPDSIVFKPAAGQVHEGIFVYVASKSKRELVDMKITNVSFNPDLIPIYSDQSEICAQLPPGFTAEKILFVVEYKTVYYYDLLQNEWEPGSTTMDELKGNSGNHSRRGRRRN